MNTALVLLGELKKHGIKIGLDDNEDLLIRGNKQALTSTLVTRIRGSKSKIIECLKSSNTTASANKVTRIKERGDTFSLSYSQQRLWLLDKIEGGTAHYNMPLCLHISGRLDIEVIRSVLETIVQRHESLRTRFDLDTDGQPLQIIQPVSHIEVPFTDLSFVAEQQRGSQANKMIAAEAASPFDLSRDIMLRGQVIQMASDQYILLVTLHHIAADGWSISILMKEFGQLYQAFSRGEKTPLPALKIQYADYSVWQRDWLKGDRLDQHLGYWEQQLAGLPVIHSMPMDHPRPVVQTFSGKVHRRPLNSDITQKLNKLCQQSDASLFMGLHAAFSVLLSRYSNETDIVVGTPTANREQAEVANLIGFFVNNLVLRSDLAGNPSFIDLLEQSRDRLIAAYQHQQAPFEQVVERLKPERSPNHSPLFQVMLVLQNSDNDSELIPGLTIRYAEHDSLVAKYDLTLLVSEREQGLLLNWEYNSALYDSETVERMAVHFECLIRSMVAAPQASVFDAELLPEAERRLQLMQWSGTRSQYPKDSCLHSLFEQQVERYPGNLAVSCDRRQLTYRELNTEVNRLCHYLREHKRITPDSLVGLCIERSSQMMIAILAILKAGGAYLPLDPSYPRDRLQFMLADSEVDLVLTESGLCSRLSKLAGNIDFLAMDALQLHRYPSDNGPIPAEHLASNLAYVIYTSGTTGKPKGVLLEHRGAVNLACAQRSRFSVTSESRVLQFGSLSFDGATFDWLMALLHGASLHICSEECRTSIDQLQEMLVTKRITHATLPPSLLHMLSPDLDYGFETLIVAGEACDQEQADAWSRRYRLINGYGPTENTVCTTTQEMSSGETVSIGRALDNTQVYVLDSRRSLLPRGATGELYIGGDGIARGYLNRPQLTDERFVINPFSANAAERLYKSGDLVRWLSNGQLAFVGRVDDQVKIRGYRIELSEIDARLSLCSGVQQAVTIVRKDKPGNKYLVSYLVRRQSTPNALSNDEWIESVRRHLQGSLPDYMMPGIFVSMDNLPLNSNGKIDKKALPKPDAESQRAKFVAPTTDKEKLICETWQDVLNTDCIGLNDNFFQMGGHSLTATRAVTRVNRLFDLSLPVNTLFQTQTVRDFVRFLDQGSSTAKPPKMQVISREGEIKPSYTQQRLWLLDKIEGGSAHYNMPIALNVSGHLDINVLQRVFTAIVERHESLRTCFSCDAQGHPVQTIQSVKTINIPLSDFSNLEREQGRAKVAEVIAEEARRGFDLSCDLMLRGQLLKLDSNHFTLLITLHHIAADGWSISILLNEFSALYKAYALGSENPLPPLSVQYADYAHWQRDWLQGDQLEQQLGYWQKQLADLPVVHSLPLDKLRPPSQTFSGDSYFSRLDKGACDKLKLVCRQSDATLFMGLHAAFSVLLSRYSGETDVVVGTTIANREQSEIASLIGFFVNNLVLRSDLSGQPSFIDLLGQSREMLLAAYAHQQAPFEQVVERLQPERSTNHSPLFQVMLILQNNEQATFDLPGLSTSIQAQRSISSKYDLTLVIEESDGGLALSWEFNTDLFKPSTIKGLSEHFVLCLRNVVVQPDLDVHQLPLLTNDDVEIIAASNNTKVIEGVPLCIHQMFEAQVELTPNAIAVISADTRVSYRELNEQANRLAGYLIEQGVTADSLVGLCVERSELMLVSLLAILKAGGAYVPLDPNYPSSRLNYMLADSNVSIVITQGHLSADLELAHRKIVRVGDDDDFSRYLPTNPSVIKCGVGSLAYVIYTSGSTGQPKGVMIEHAALTNFIHAMASQPGCDQTDRLLAVTSLSFDIHTLEMYLPLVSGACVVMTSAGEAADPQALARLIEHHHISIMQATPITWQMLVDSHWVAKQKLKVMCGGEALTSSLKDSLTAQQHIELWNMYGPTETSVWSSIAKLDADADADGDVTVGEPINNTEFHVLDKHLSPVPVGVVGELLISGAGLARGYLNKQTLTDEKFIDLDLGNGRIVTAYRTGDLVRQRETGDYLCLGRIDHQVKIRGFRVELGEIEKILLDHKQVTQALVIVKSPQSSIVAYVVCERADKDKALIEALRQYVKQTLPDYMVPATFMLLDRMPMTPNGKRDRNALPEPLATTVDEYKAPGTEIEIKLCQIWSQLLNAEKIGINDDFFQLGGHSMLVVQLVRVLKEWGLHVTIKQVFDNPTIARLLSVAKSEAEGDSLAQTMLVGESPLLINHHWFLKRLNPSHWNYFRLFELDVEYKKELIIASLKLMIEHHDGLRRVFVSKNNHHYTQRFRKPSEMGDWWKAHDLSSYNNEAASEYIETVCRTQQRSLDIHEKLFNVVYFDLGDKRSSRLLIATHQILIDPASAPIFFEDLFSIYRDLDNKIKPRLPKKTTSILDWSKWQVKYTHEQAPAFLEYWRTRAWDKYIPLPVDDNPEVLAPANSESEVKLVYASMSEEQTIKLERIAANAGLNVNHFLVAALILAYKQWTGSSALLLLFMHNGRSIKSAPTIDLSRTIGWLPNYCNLMLDLTDCNDDEIARTPYLVKQQMEELCDDGLSYSCLRYMHEDIGIRKEMSELPEFQLEFTYTPSYKSLSTDNQMAVGVNPATESVGTSQGEMHPSFQPFGKAYHLDGKLSIHWGYCPQMYSEITMQNFIDSQIKHAIHLVDEFNEEL